MSEIDKSPKHLKDLCRYHDFFHFLNRHLDICRRFLKCWKENTYWFEDNCEDVGMVPPVKRHGPQYLGAAPCFTVTTPFPPADEITYKHSERCLDGSCDSTPANGHGIGGFADCDFTLNGFVGQDQLDFQSNCRVHLVDMVGAGGVGFHRYLYPPPGTLMDDAVRTPAPNNVPSDLTKMSFCFEWPKQVGLLQANVTESNDVITASSAIEVKSAAAVKHNPNPWPRVRQRRRWRRRRYGRRCDRHSPKCPRIEQYRLIQWVEDVGLECLDVQHLVHKCEHLVDEVEYFHEALSKCGGKHHDWWPKRNVKYPDWHD